MIKLNFKNSFILFLAAILIFNSCIDIYFDSKNHPEQSVTEFKRNGNDLRFMLLSDWGFNGGFEQQNVANSMAYIARLAGLDFILTSGDNFQYNGVESANDALWQVNFENIYNDSSLNVTWYPALGNHDHYGNIQAETDYSFVNPKWHLPSPYYSFKKQINETDSILFITLDTQTLCDEFSNYSDSSDYNKSEQYKWLLNTLQTNTTKWTIVTGHHPVFSASEFHGDTPAMKSMIKPLLDKYRVDMYLCGHDHDFEHAKDKNQFTDYIVAGTGAYLRSAGVNEHTIQSYSEPGFVYFIASQSSIRLFYITTKNYIQYSFIKTKTPLNNR